jgi:hypothetical protein
MSSARNRRPLAWNETQLQVLDLVFEGRRSQEWIAQACTVPVRTLKDWLAHPDFKQALADKRADIIAALDQVAYVRKEQRITALSQMAELAREQFEAKPLLVEVRPTSVEGEPITNESFNRDAHQAFRESLADIAAELGARKVVNEITGGVEIEQRIQFYWPRPELAPPED